MDDPEAPECHCGSTSFERVVVARPGGGIYRTEFIACEHCRIMFWKPQQTKPADGFDMRQASEELSKVLEARERHYRSPKGRR